MGDESAQSCLQSGLQTHFSKLLVYRKKVFQMNYQPSESSKTPLYESNLLWGPIGILTAIATSMRNWHWLVFVTLPFFGLLLYRYTKRTKEKWLIFSLGVLILVATLYGLDLLLRPHETVANRSSGEDRVQVPAIAKSEQPAPTKPGETPKSDRHTALKNKPAPSPAAVQNCPNGNCIGGDNYGNPTVNNYGPPSRHITDSDKTSLIDCLSKHPGSVGLGAIEGDLEAYNFAEDWEGVFRKAGWKIDDGRISLFIVGGGVMRGAQIHVHGSIDPDGKNPKYDPNSPSGAFTDCVINNKTIPGAIIPSEDVDPNRVAISVGPRIQP